MLSRVANALFWMSRYLERAEHTARLLDVGFHLELDLHGVLVGPHEWHWNSLVTILQGGPVPATAGSPPQTALTRWFTFDLDNPGSILCCLNRARNNARGVREALSPEVWGALNRLHWQLRDPDFSRQAEESPHDFYQAVAVGSHLVQGACDATMTRDEGWHFLQLGKYLERADKTLRTLNVKYHLLQDLTSPGDLPLSNLQWAGVLRNCAAYEAYQRRYISRVEPERVVEFLLLHPDFPRSVRFCLEAAGQAVAAIEGPGAERGEGPAGRLLGRVLSDLRFAELDQLLAGDLHAFLEGILARCNQVSRSVQERYALA
jgi:uncharacterized alpha-E superfamily protein